MAEGEILQLKDQSGGLSLTSTAQAIVWDKADRLDPAFTLSAGRSAITINETGKYLVIANVGLENNETSVLYWIRSVLHINAVASNYAWSYGLIEGTNSSQECFPSFVAVEQFTAGDVVELMVHIESTILPSGGNYVRTIANRSAIQLIRLVDAWDYCRVRRSSIQGISGTGFVEVQWNSQTELDTGTFGHSTSTLPAEIEIKTSGKYLIAAVVTAVEVATGIVGIQAEVRLLFDGVELPGARSSALITDTNGANMCTMNVFWYGDLAGAAGKKLTVEIRRKANTTGTITFRVQQNRTGISVVKVPDSAESIILQDDDWATTPQPSDVDGNLNWTEEVEKDTTAFTHAANDDVVELARDGTFLFGACWRTDRTGTSTDILVHHLMWRREDLSTDLAYGRSSVLDHGEILSVQFAGAGHSNGLLLPNMVGGEQISFKHVDESSSTDSTADFDNADAGLPAGYSPIRLFAIRLEGWFNPMPKPVSGRSIGNTTSACTLKVQSNLVAKSLSSAFARAGLLRSIAVRAFTISSAFGRAQALCDRILQSRTISTTTSRIGIRTDRAIQSRSLSLGYGKLSLISTKQLVGKGLCVGYPSLAKLSKLANLVGKTPGASYGRLLLNIISGGSSPVFLSGRTLSLTFARALLTVVEGNCADVDTETDLEIAESVLEILNSSMSQTVTINRYSRSYSPTTRQTIETLIDSTQLRATTPIAYKHRYRPHEVVKDSDMQIYIAGSFIPTMYSSVMIGSDEWTVVYLKKFYSGRRVAVYELSIRALGEYLPNIPSNTDETEISNDVSEQIEETGKTAHFKIRLQTPYSADLRQITYTDSAEYCRKITAPVDEVKFDNNSLRLTGRVKTGIASKGLPFVPTLNMVMILENTQYNIVEVNPIWFGSIVVYYEIFITR